MEKRECVFVILLHLAQSFTVMQNELMHSGVLHQTVIAAAQGPRQVRTLIK